MKHALLVTACVTALTAVTSLTRWARTACWTPQQLCVRSHYVSETCITMVDVTGQGTLMAIPSECGRTVCDEYAHNHQWDADPKCRAKYVPK